MSENSLTLYSIETGILEQLQLREFLFEASEMPEQERTALVLKCDERIMELLKREITKVDGVSYNLMEFERRADILYDEAKRLKARGDQQQARHDRLQTMVISIMQMMDKTELEGQNSTLKLRDNPPKVEVIQEALLPAEYRRTTVTLDQRTWERIAQVLIGSNASQMGNDLRTAVTAGKTEPKRAEIASVLKSTEPCSKCGGKGKLPGTDWGRCSGCGNAIDSQHKPSCARQGIVTEESDYSDRKDCDLCKGTGSISKGVPGARLVSGVRLEIK